MCYPYIQYNIYTVLSVYYVRPCVILGALNYIQIGWQHQPQWECGKNPPYLPTYLSTPPHCTLASPLICDARYSRIRSRSRSRTRPALRGAPISSLTIERVLRNVLQISPHEADKEGGRAIEKERDEVIERERGMQRTREELLPQ